jgi:hypothetical protein
MDEWLSRLRFGVMSSVYIDADSSKNPWLGDRLQELPLSVRTVRVQRETFDLPPDDDDSDSFAESESPSPSPSSVDDSVLAAVVLALPAHIRSLIFEQDGRYTMYEEECTLDTLPPFEEWTLPAGLTELHLPRYLQLDEEGQGAAVQLPPQLVKLRLGSRLNHSLAKLKLPASLRVLRLGAYWNQLASDWPLLPDGLEELELSGRFNQPLSSLCLPSSLRKLHVLTSSGTAAQERDVAHLFDDPTPCMFPPRLESLQLPPPLTAEQEAEQDEQVNIEQAVGRPKVRIWTGSPPLNLGLLPPSLRTLRIHQSQPLVCDPPSALASLQLEQLSVFHRGSDNRRVSRRYHRAEERRARLRRQLSQTAKQYKAAGASKNGGATNSASSTSTVAASSAPTAEAPDVAHPSAFVSAAPSFTMGASKHG